MHSSVQRFAAIPSSSGTNTLEPKISGSRSVKILGCILPRSAIQDTHRPQSTNWNGSELGSVHINSRSLPRRLVGETFDIASTIDFAILAKLCADHPRAERVVSPVRPQYLRVMGWWGKEEALFGIFGASATYYDPAFPGFRSGLRFLPCRPGFQRLRECLYYLVILLDTSTRLEFAFAKYQIPCILLEHKHEKGCAVENLAHMQDVVRFCWEHVLSMC